MSMNDREVNQVWLLSAAKRRPDGWEATWIALYGMEGSLDMLAAQEGRVWEINLTHRPFCNDDELKRAVRDARGARSELSRIAYERWWADVHAHDAERAATR